MKYLICLLIFFVMVLGLSSQTLFFNEIVYDTPGGDTNTFIELKGSPGMLLDSFYVIGINGNGGAVYATIPLLGYTIPADSYFVIGQAATVPNVDLINALANLQNGADNIIITSDFSGVIDTIDAVGYGYFFTEIFVGEGVPTYDVNGIPLARYYSTDYNNNYWDYTAFKNRTPGYGNPLRIPATIYEIQNSADVSPLQDSTVYVSGIVTAVFPSENICFIQSGSGAYNGIAVEGDKRLDSMSVNDTILIYSGFIFEDNDRTTIMYPMTGNSSTGATAISTTLSLDSIGEPYEGQLITVNNVIITDTLGFGELEIKDLDSNFSRIDDYETYTVPVIGDKFASITGILEYTYGDFKIEPRDNNDLVYGYLLSGTIGLSDNPADSSGTEVFFVEAGITDSTDASGYYEFDFVPVGSYTLILSHAGYDPDTINAVFTGAETFDETLNVAATTYTVSGIVGLSDAPADSSGSIVNISELAAADTTDATGYYEFTGINDGVYTLIFTHTGYVPDTIIDTVQGSNLNIDVTLIDLSGIEDIETLNLQILSSFTNKNGIISFIFNKESNETAKINIFDITGRNIINRNITGEPGIYEMSIDHRLSKGIYFLNINYFNGKITRKFAIID